MSVRIRRSAIALALVALGAATPSAVSKTTTVTVPAEFVVMNGQRPGDPGDCSAIGFVRWPDRAGTVSAKAIYTYKGVEQSKSAAPPFDDTYEWVATYTVTPGFHWIAISKSWVNGSQPNTCESDVPRIQALYGTTARVELEVEIDPRVCTAARARLNKSRTRVAALADQLGAASTARRRAALRAALDRAKADRTKAGKAVREAC